MIRVEIQDRDTSVVNNTIQLRLNGQPLTHQVTDTPEGAVVTASISPLPPSGATQSAQISFRDNQNQEISATWGFIVTYRALDPANRKVGPGSLPGFQLRVVQAPAGSNLENSLGRAEEQLRPNSSIPAAIDAAETAVIINFSKNEGSADGFFPDDTMVPGLGFDNGLDDFVVESQMLSRTYRRDSPVRRGHRRRLQDQCRRDAVRHFRGSARLPQWRTGR